MSEMSKETYIALQMACELRQIITDKLGGVPALGLSDGCYPLPPLDNESFEDSCRRIFGDFVFTKVVYERMAPEMKYPKRFYGKFKPKGPLHVQRNGSDTDWREKAVMRAMQEDK